ncbi:MAG: NAD(P)-dependent oxidoreductase [Pseudomonadota bacterium]|nr:NAD(P)-dependent oxidoreductase [Pseudomonadota bacterium]
MISAILSSDAAAQFAGQRVLLTGASGYLGGHVARQAFAAGVELHELGRRAGASDASFHPADLTDGAAVARIVMDVRPTAVIHCAAAGVTYGAVDFAAMLAVAVGGTRALYEACAALPQPPAVVHVGTGYEYGASDLPVTEDQPIVPSASVYGAAKAASSAVAGGFAASLRIMLLRPFYIYGGAEARGRLGPMLIAKARAGERVELTGGAQQRDFLHVDDAAGCIWTALAKAARADTPGLTVLNVGSGTAITLRHFFEVLAAQLQCAGFPPDLALGALPYRADQPMVSLPDVTRLFATLDWRPRVSLEQGIADLVQQELASCP